MSAIAGIFFFGGAPVEHGWIEKLTAAMRSRGPDEQTHWVQGSIALGHCMLRTTPESLEEHQPLISQDKNLVLVWDGRLDNREELQRNLKSAGIVLRDNSDAELVLNGYAIWGEECLKQLLGDFAFVVWDARQGKLFCARDHMGARPFYFTSSKKYFAFASDEEALTKLPGISSRPNEELIAYYLAQDFVDFDPAQSWVESVRILLPAQSMTVPLDGKPEVRKYWELKQGEDNTFATDEDCQEAFIDVFGRAVHSRMRSCGHLSVMVSGGLDTAGIVAMCKRLLPEMPGKELHSYSAISDHPEACIESQCILDLTQELGDKAHYVSVPSFSGMLSVQDLISTAWGKSHPVDNSILLPAMMAMAASRDGHRVMLHGVSGDLTMHVPLRYIAHYLKAGQWRQAWNECLGASRNNTYLRGISPLRLLLQNAWTASAPSILKILLRNLRTSIANPPLSGSLIDEAFSRKLKLSKRMVARQRKDVGRMLSLQDEYVRSMLPPHGINLGLSGYDHVGGSYSMELRDPWGDKRVVEFFMRLPLKYKVRDGWTKYLLRASFASDLKSEIRSRIGKEHLGWDFACRLMDDSDEWISKYLKDNFSVVEKYINKDAFHDEYKKYRATKGDVERQYVYDTMVLILWAQRLLK